MDVFNMEIINCLISPLIALIFAPMMFGVINKTKAAFAGRKGAPVLQLYYDLFRLLHKSSVISETTSIIFRIAPTIILGTIIGALFLVPINHIFKCGAFTGDFVLLFYLLAFGRFFMIIAALDTGSAFEGMGASREAFFAALVEPIIFIIILTLLRLNHTTSMVAALSLPASKNWIIILLIAIPMFIILLIENSRVPFDDPTTHLELTMVHEVMILDHSGIDLAILEYASSLKFWLFSLVFVRIIFPFSDLGIFAETFLTISMIMLTSIAVGVVESVMARSSLLKIPQLMYSAGVIACLGFYLTIGNIIKW